MYQRTMLYWGHVNADIQKSVRLNSTAVQIIESVPGRSFSDKVRNMAYEYQELVTKKSDQ